MTMNALPRSLRSLALWRVLAVASAILTGAAHAEPIGLIKVQSGEAYIERQGTRVPAAADVPVDRGDRIVTGHNGSVSLTFNDGAVLSAGPGSVLVLDAFNYDPTTRAGNFDVTLVRGTLSAISGRLVIQTPGAMKVRTPTAVIGVRGTEFVVHVDAPE